MSEVVLTQVKMIFGALLLVVTMALSGCAPTAALDSPVAQPIPENSPFAPAATGSPQLEKPASAPPAAGSTPKDGAIRLGCHTYCLNAGGYGGDEKKRKPMSDLTINGPVAMRVDGTVALRVRCRVALDCAGAILLWPDWEAMEVPDPTDSVDEGRSDLDVPAGQSRLLAVPLPSSAIEMVERGESVQLDVFLDTHPTYDRYSAKRQRGLDWVPGFDLKVVGS